MDNDQTVQQPPKQTLKTARCIRVPVLEDDEAVIKANAKAVRLSTAEYLRRLGRGQTLPSTLDLQAVDTLAKVNADQGRLGGLLKLWLTDETKFRVFADQRDVRSCILELLQQLVESQKQLLAAMERIVDRSSVE
jgi:hypothetical protein